MPFLQVPRTFTAQPQYNAPITSDGLAKGAQFLFNPAVGPVDIVTGRKWGFVGDAKAVATRHGKAFDFDGNGDYLDFTGYPEITGNVGTFAAWLPRVGVESAFGHIYMSESTATVFHQFHPDGTVYFGGVPSSGTLSGWFSTTDRSFVLTTDGTAAGSKLLVDGKDSGLTWASPPAAWPAGSKDIRLGGYTGGVAWDTNASMMSVVQESRPWVEAEGRIFHESKGLALLRAQRRLFFFPSAATPGTTHFRSTLSAMGTRSGSRQVHR